MDARYVSFTAADPVFYDVPWADEHGTGWGDEVACLRGELPSGWSRHEEGPWVVLTDGRPTPATGWKVHVAALPPRAALVIDATVRACWDAGVPVKALRSRRLVLVSQGKYASRTSSGKVLTAYPRDVRALEHLIADLSIRLAGEPAPKVAGDLAIAGAPLSVRYGAFAESWVADQDGTPVPAMRRNGVVLPDRRLGDPLARHEGDAPLVVTRALQQVAEAAQRATIDVTDVQVLHRSNAGAVYRCKRPDGRVVVLKEARRWAGLDADGVDASRRLRHEGEVLQHLQGSGVVPQFLDRFTLGDSDFLVMEHVEGDPLNVLVGRQHPEARTDAGPDAVAAYATWAARTSQLITEAVEELHARGVVHGDLHPGNVLLAADRAVLVDLESAALEGHAVSHGIAAPGFGAGADGGPVDEAVDDRALDLLRLSLLMPVVPVLHRRPELAADLAVTARAVIPVPSSYRLPLPPGHSVLAAVRAPVPSHLVAGILASASPQRADRLFPGDIAQFDAPRQGLGIAHGAAGVLLALASAGLTPAPFLVDWLCERALERGPRPRGFWEGSDGVALALALLGRRAEAAALVDTFEHEDPWEYRHCPWWGRGSAGVAVASAELADQLHRPDLRARAQELCDGLVRVVMDPAEPAGHRPGIEQGWTGIALALLRVAELEHDAAEASRLVDAAEVALGRDLHCCRWRGGALLALDGGRLLPYLGIGSAGIGLAADVLRRLRPDPRWDDVVAGTVVACQVLQVVPAALWQGRSALVMTLDRLGAEPTARGEHRRRLGWHTVRTSVEGCTPVAEVVLGQHFWRCSTDLATGAAGVLLAATSSSTDPLRDVLRLPVHRVPSDLPDPGPIRPDAPSAVFADFEEEVNTCPSTR